MTFYSNPRETNPIDEAISVANNKMFSVHQLADSNGNIIDPAGSNEYAIIKLADNTGEQISADNPLPVSIGGESVTITGSVTIPGTIEIANEEGNPIPTHTHLFDESENEYSASNPLTVDGTVNIGTMPEV